MEISKLENSTLFEYQPDTLQYMRKIYNMEGDRMKQSIDLLEEWIKKQSHFVKKDIDRRYLEITIMSAKGSVEKSKRQIDRLCTLKTLVPKFFITNDIRNNFKNISDVSCIMPLPKMDKDYARVFLIKVFDKELTTALFLDFYRYIIVICEYIKAHDYANGFTAILDIREVNLYEAMKKLNPIDVQHILTILIEGYGARIFGIHLFTRSKVIELLLSTIKPLLTQKIADRMHVHQENEDLYSIVDKEIMPIEYGGKEKSIYELQKLWIDAISSEKFENYLTEMKELRTNETFRQAEKFNENCMGLPGSFRTLSVD